MVRMRASIHAKDQTKRHRFSCKILAPLMTGILSTPIGCSHDELAPFDQPSSTNRADPDFHGLDLDDRSVAWRARKRVASDRVFFACTDCRISNRYAPEVICRYEEFNS